MPRSSKLAALAVAGLVAAAVLVTAQVAAAALVAAKTPPGQITGRSLPLTYEAALRWRHAAQRALVALLVPGAMT